MRLNPYDKISNTYSKQTNNEGTILLAYREFAALIKKYVTSDGNRALDFGSGTGRSRRYLEEAGFDADGVDIDPDMIAKSKEIDNRNSDKYQLISNSVIPHRSFKYDLTFSSLVVLELGTKKELLTYFLEAYRIMKFDGTLIVLTVNDDFYKHQWTSIDTDFPGNNDAKSGDKVKVRIKEINLELEDYYWTKEDYRSIAKESGLTILEEIEPIGNVEDGIDWLNESQYPPYVIFVMKKTKSLENLNNVLLKHELNVDIPGKGIFREIYKSSNIVKQEELPKKYSGDRYESATIRLLMRPGDYWPFHRLKSKETFNHIEGNDLIIHSIDNRGNYQKIFLGQEHDNAVKEYSPPEDCWYAEEVCGKNGYALVEVTTKPAFDINDHEEATRNQLLSLVSVDNSKIIELIHKNFIPSSIVSKESFLASKKISAIESNFSEGLTNSII